MGAGAVDCRATMRLPVSRILLFACALLAVVPATASAAAAPKETSVAPLALKAGDTMTVRGKGFLAGKNRNTVIFKAIGTRAVFAKAQTATKTKIVVKVPAKLLSFLKVRNGQSVATRFQIRVLAKRLSPTYTPAGKSPVIAPATTSGAGGAPVAPAKPTPPVTRPTAGGKAPGPPPAHARGRGGRPGPPANAPPAGHAADGRRRCGQRRRARGRGPGDPRRRRLDPRGRRLDSRGHPYRRLRRRPHSRRDGSRRRQRPPARHGRGPDRHERVQRRHRRRRDDGRLGVQVGARPRAALVPGPRRLSDAVRRREAVPVQAPVPEPARRR